MSQISAFGRVGRILERAVVDNPGQRYRSCLRDLIHRVQEHVGDLGMLTRQLLPKGGVGAVIGLQLR